MKRVATALVLIPVVVWLVLKAPWWAFATVLAAVGLLAFHEFDRIASLQRGMGQGVTRAGWPGMAAGLALLFAPDPFLVVALAAVVAMTLALRVSDLTRALPSASAFLLGIVYIFGAWRCAGLLRDINPHWLMIALLVSWAGDTAALYTGKAFGKHKLAPHVSPGKTWEGSLGSVVGAAIAASIYAYYLIPAEPMAVVLVIAAVANVAGQAGDLCESAFKRGAEIKDSGTMLPGHGGWLDRIDSTLFTVPVVYAAQVYMMNHVHV
jgi:phosphatidate cytidylyltransferase